MNQFIRYEAIILLIIVSNIIECKLQEHEKVKIILYVALWGVYIFINYNILKYSTNVKVSYTLLLIITSVIGEIVSENVDLIDCRFKANEYPFWYKNLATFLFNAVFLGAILAVVKLNSSSNKRIIERGKD